MKLDILAIGVHPDDVELGCSGTLLKEIMLGKKVGILDLTQGELGTRGTIETRYQEAAKAAMLLGVHVRENLKMRDGFFLNDENHQLQLIQIIRKYKPDIILANALKDRHPDHGKAGNLIEDACFLSGLSKIITKDDENLDQLRWRPAYILHYAQDRFYEPDVIIDISDFFEKKIEAIKAYSTQFYVNTDSLEGTQTYISSPQFLEAIIANATLMGKRIGVKHAEGFICKKTISLKNLDALVLNET